MVHEVKIQIPDQATPIKVKFPFEPYSVQVDIMAGTLRGLFGAKNALIESPTGTGKTQALLCAASAFVLHQKALLRRFNNTGHNSALMCDSSDSSSDLSATATMAINSHKKIRILYASRTHSQLAQVVREFKASPYSKVLQMAVLGSREHLCVHSRVNELPTSQAQNAACNALRAERGCRYFHGTANFMADEQMEVQREQQRVLQREKDREEEMAFMRNDKSENDNNDQEQQHHQDSSSSTAEPSGPLQVGLHDIEDLGNLGRTVGFCPYFYEREIAESADIVFLPYSYIFDPQVVTQLPFSLDGCSLILDEAHNVPSYLASSKCLTLTPRDTGSAVQDCTKAHTHCENQIRSVADGTSALDAGALHALKADMDDIAALKMFLLKLEQEITNVLEYEKASRQQQNNNNNSSSSSTSNNNNNKDPSSSTELIKRGIFMLEFLANRCCNLSSQTWLLMSDAITRAIGRLNESGASVVGLTKINDFFNAIFQTPVDNLTSETSAYKFVVFPYNTNNNNNNNNDHHHQHPQNTSRNCLGFWCLDCSVGMNELDQRVSSMILASGTLSPMPHFAAELGIPFPITVQGGHVIKNNQLLSLVMRRGPSGVNLNSAFTNRNNTEYSKQLGLALVHLAQTVPDGMIVFFPSYAAMGSALDAWKNRPVGNVNTNTNATNTAAPPPPNSAAQQHQTIWGMLSEVKPIHVEPRDTTESNAVVKEYRKAIDDHHQHSTKNSNNNKGAILLAVCRGKISEGLDFADRHGRCVVVTGLPFAHHGDLFVRLKKSYITAVAQHRPRIDGKLFTGDDWYKNEAMRAVNQALGRVIRHKEDYGCVVLADERFASHIRALSGWVRKDSVVCAEFRDACQRANTFFTNWKAAEAAQRDREAAEKKKKYLEEKRRLMMLTNSNMIENSNNGKDGEDDDDDGRDITEEDISSLASRAAEQAALAMREEKRRKQQQQQEQQNQTQNQSSSSNSVLQQMLGRPLFPSATTSSSSAGSELPAPVALRGKSIFQKSTLRNPTKASINENLVQQQQQAQNVGNNNNNNQMMMMNVNPPPPPPKPQQQPSLTTGNSAAEFCERLKRLVTPEQYQDFRSKLKNLLQHQRNSATNEQQQQQQQQDFISVFRQQVEGIQQVFDVASDVDERESLAVDFGCFVPVNLRVMYSEMVNRRRSRS